MPDSFSRRATLGAAAGVLGWTALSVGGNGQAGSGGGGRGAPPDFGGWLDGANNYDGTVVDRRGQATVTVRVGAGDSKLAFAPAAIHVDNGATVRWRWTGKGGVHSVLSQEDGPLDSGSPVGEAGVNYEYTFERDGIYPYHCLPHGTAGMRGAIVVGTDYPRREVTPSPTPTPRPTAEGEWPAASGTAWPEAGFDAANTRNPDVNGPIDDVRASGRLGFGEPMLGLVSDGERLYVGRPETVLAVDATTGERLWERPGEWPLAVGDGRLYVVENPDWHRERSETNTLRSAVVCFDAASGQRQWRRRLPNGPVHTLSLADGRLAVGATGGNGVLDAATGDRRWWRETRDTVAGLAVRDGRLYVSASANFGTSVRDARLRLRAYDIDGGARQWQFERVSFPPTAPVATDDVVYVGSESHAVHARDAASGDPVWTADLGSSATGLAVADGSVYVGCHDYHLYAFDAAAGDRQWRTRTRGTVGPPTVAGEDGESSVVYAANLGAVGGFDDDGDPERSRAVHAFDPATGESRWTTELGRWQDTGTTPADVHVAPLLTDGTLYVPENRTREPHRLNVVTGATARTESEGETERPATSTGEGAGFTAVGTALAMLGVAGLQRWRDGD